MRERHSTLAGLLALAVALMVTSLAGAGAVASESDQSWIGVSVAKTRSKIIVLGEASGPRPGQRLFLKLLRTDSEGERKLIARKRVRVVEGSGGALTYRATFDRPLDGTCDVRIRFRGNEDHAPARSTQQFPCANQVFPKGQAVLHNGETPTTIDLLIADTLERRNYGLMYRLKLREDKGMVFTWDEDVHFGFYMKNTLLPLSIAFFDANGVVQEILDMEPCSQDPCPIYAPAEPYRGALEVNQGMFGQWDIAAGDTITFSPGT